MITSKIRQRIQELSTEYNARLQVVELKARQLLEYSQGGTHLTFTPHGLSHVSAVEGNYDWLLPEIDLKAFNASELFCLICATFFHDALMIPRKPGDELKARQEHIQGARDFLLRNVDLLGLSIHEANAIAEVIQGHGVSGIGDIAQRVVLGPEVLDLRKLGACLSLADLCHADASRAPEIVLRHLDLNEDSSSHWRRHLQISGITREEDVILMSALTFSDQGAAAVGEYKQLIEQQLATVRPYFETVLRPIRGVELIESRLESPLDQTLQFNANTPAILKLLIEGVYEREDVFIRELVQNSLDSCLLRRAKELRRSAAYTPQILLTVFTDHSHVKALRIDDNGIGMDLSDVQDTLLWIGNSISSNSEVVNLLQKTLGKDLIAAFGIGLLSCFKASKDITIRTRKEGETPLQFRLSSVSDSVKPEKASDLSVGTTVIVELPGEKRGQVDVGDAMDYYFRMVHQAEMRRLDLDWDPELAASTRDEILKIAVTEAVTVEGTRYFDSERDTVGISIQGDDYSGSIWLPETGFDGILDREGEVDVLNEGIFVTRDLIAEWLPANMSFCDAVFNFSSKSLSLPAGRDRVVRDERFRRKKAEIAGKSFALVPALVRYTSRRDNTQRDFSALVLTHMYARSDERSKERILRELDEYFVRRYKRDDGIKLGSLREMFAEAIYLQYEPGRFVSELANIDGKLVYHKEDDFVELQSALMAQEGNVVVSTVRNDHDKPVLEAALINAYLEFHKRPAVDLVKTNVIEGKQRSRPVPSSVRQELGTSAKFVEISGLPTKKSWKVGNELWINLANPTMRKLYAYLQRGDLDPGRLRFASALFSMLAYKFDDAIETIATWIES